jgi:amino acid permease
MDSYESDHRATDHSSISLHSNTTSDISPLLQNTRAQSSSTASRGPVIEVEDDAENHIVYGKSNEPSATIASSVINLANTILGAGMLAMPAAVASVGLGFGILLILFSGCCSGFGLFLLSRSATRTIGRHASFFSVAQLTYAKAAMVIDLAIAIKCFGVGVSYLIIIGDLMPEVMTGVGIEGDGILHSRSFWITVFMLIIIPLSFLKRLDSLRYTSMAALGAVVYLFGIVVYFYFFPSVDSNVDEVIRPTSPPITWFRFSKRFFTSLPIFVFAFTCHQNVSICVSLGDVWLTCI